MSSSVQPPLPPIRNWPLGFCDCCSYQDAKGDCQFIYFVLSCVHTCCVLGEIHTLLNEQRPTCCHMSNEGLGICILTIPACIFGPLGGICWTSSCSAKFRHDTVLKYRIDDKDDTRCCCCTLPTCCVGCFFPCSLFQVLMTLRHFQNEDQGKRIQTNGTLQTPLIK
jgi:hypothetical protein